MHLECGGRRGPQHSVAAPSVTRNAIIVLPAHAIDNGFWRAGALRPALAFLRRRSAIMQAGFGAGEDAVGVREDQPDRWRWIEAGGFAAIVMASVAIHCRAIRAPWFPLGDAVELYFVRSCPDAAAR